MIGVIEILCPIQSNPILNKHYDLDSNLFEWLTNLMCQSKLKLVSQIFPPLEKFPNLTGFAVDEKTIEFI